MVWDGLRWVWDWLGLLGLGWDGLGLGGLGWVGIDWDRFVGYGFGWVKTGWDVMRFYNTVTHRDFTFPAISF